MTLVGTMLQQYRILEPLDRGGMGVVYLAEDTRLGRQVALKILPPDTFDKATRARFAQEARAAAALAHPAIAAVYELGESSGEMFIALEYVKGETLRTFVRPGGLDADTALEIALDVGGALEAAHAAGVVHRDLKPENIMRTPDGRCKVLDFGLARIDSIPDDAFTVPRLTQAGMIVGTVGYMSPEQLEGSAVDFRSDVFAFGTLLYELATGVHPFHSGTTTSTLTAVLTAEPPPPASRSSRHPIELDRIVRKCLRKRREERYQSTRDLVVDLKHLRRQEAGAEVASSPAQRASKALLWWWAHNLSSCFVLSPLAAYLAWSAREALNNPTGNALFLAEVLSLCLLFAVRFMLICVAVGHPHGLEREARRMRPWIPVTSLAIVAGLLALAAAVSATHVGLAAVIGGMGGMGLVVTLVFNPAVDRAAFCGDTP